MYATRAELLAYLDQLDGDTSKYPTLDAVLERAAALINLDLGVTADLTPAAAGTQVVYGDGTRYLVPRGPISAVTLVSAASGVYIPAYVVQDGILVASTSIGAVVPVSWWGTTGVWAAGVPFTVAATFGYSSQVMTALKEANLQIAVRLWRFRESGGSEVIGAESGVVEVRQQFSPMVKDILRLVNRERHGVAAGVW